MTPQQLKLAAYARRVLSGLPASSLESIGPAGGSFLEAAHEGLEAAFNDTSMTFLQQAALEAVVHKVGRPAVLIKQDSFDNIPDPWAMVSAQRDLLKPVIQSIGRVEATDVKPFGGTGFFVAPNVILTNRHVGQLFTYGVGGTNKLKFIPGRVPSLNTGREVQQPPNADGSPPAGLSFRVVKPLMIHPHWDAAFLEVEPDDPTRTLPQMLTLASTAPNDGNFADRDVVVIGYPYASAGHDPEVLRDIFGGILGVKRLQPGKLVDERELISFGHPVRALVHDASTLGGNSGSAVIDLETQQVLALHFAGTYLEANFSVPTWQLALDPRVVDLGLNLQPAPAKPQPRTAEEGGPIWLKAWKGREPDAAAAPATVQEAAPAPLPPSRTRLLDPAWFERYSDIELARLYQRDPEAVRELIAASFPAAEQQDLMDTLLSRASTESVPEAAVDPDLPEIVLLPGIMGSHLDAGWRPRAWFNPLTLPFSNLRADLGLDANGNDPNGLSPDGLVSSAYSTAARRWRNQGFRVHEFGYDWRKPLATSANALDSFLRNRRRERPAARFVLVTHSMGTLVSAVYSLQTPDWRDFVTQGIFCGGPLGGSFAIPYMLSGEWPSVKKLAAVSLRTSIEDMRAMGASFPGALEMLPHPALFSTERADVEELYRPGVYASFARPAADWLNASRALKNRLREAPVLSRSTLLINIDLPTACTFTKVNGIAMTSRETTRGDGTVAARSSFVEGVPAFKVAKPHGDLMLDELVIETVPQLIRGEAHMLSKVTAEDIKKPLAAAGPAPEAAVDPVRLEVRAAEVRERMRNGMLTTEDVRWMLNPEP